MALKVRGRRGRSQGRNLVRTETDRTNDLCRKTSRRRRKKPRRCLPTCPTKRSWRCTASSSRPRWAIATHVRADDAVERVVQLAVRRKATTLTVVRRYRTHATQPNPTSSIRKDVPSGTLGTDRKVRGRARRHLDSNAVLFARQRLTDSPSSRRQVFRRRHEGVHRQGDRSQGGVRDGLIVPIPLCKRMTRRTPACIATPSMVHVPTLVHRTPSANRSKRIPLRLSSLRIFARWDANRHPNIPGPAWQLRVHFVLRCRVACAFERVSRRVCARQGCHAVV